MKTTKTLLVLTVMALVACGASTLAAPAPQIDKGAVSMGKGEEAAADDPFALLAGFTGTWEVQMRTFGSPDAEPEVSQGTTINEMVLDGKFLQMRYKGTFQRKTFVGMGFDSYDEARDKYVSVWMDSITPGFSTMEGDWDPESKSWTYFGQGTDPATGKVVEMKSVVKVRSAGMRTYESWTKTADGEWTKSMEVIFGKVK